MEYIGIGAVWGTQTKALTNPIIGVRGVGEMLEVLDKTDIKAVAIGTPPCQDISHRPGVDLNRWH